MRNETLERVTELLSGLKERQLEAVEGYIKDAVLPAGGEKKPEASSGGIIEVSRSEKPKYPTWMKKLRDPELELLGPQSYPLKELKKFQHAGQAQPQGESLQVVYEHLKRRGMLEWCLTLLDGEAISKIGIEEFRKLSQGQDLFLWGTSIFYGESVEDIDVAYLREENDRVHIRWKSIKSKVNGNSVCLMHPEG
jgi:hypothetical protein